jgi:hypothetical protein
MSILSLLLTEYVCSCSCAYSWSQPLLRIVTLLVILHSMLMHINSNCLQHWSLTHVLLYACETFTLYLQLCVAR